MPQSVSSRSALRQSRSVDDLMGDKRAFDIRVGYNRKKIPPLPNSEKAPKALVVTVFRNGDPYYPGFKASLRPGKHFLNLAGFCDYLSQRVKIAQGVRHIFDLDGKEIHELTDLEDGGSYVASGTKTFKEDAYGKLARIHTSQVIRPVPAPMRPDDMLLFRQPHHESPEGLSLPGSRESCVVTVVNRREPAKRSRVLLNLKTRQGWEDVLRDMGQAVGLKRAKRMLTPWGEEVKSFSHMKHDFGDVETFYLDTSKSKSVPQRSNSDSNLREAALGSSLRIKIPDDNRNKFSPE